MEEQEGLQTQQHQKGLLAKSLQEEGEEELYKIKQISAQGPLQPMADDDSDMADIMRERFPEDDKYGSKCWLKKKHVFVCVSIKRFALFKSSKFPFVAFSYALSAS